MITGNPEQFNGVIEIWRQRGWLKKWQKEADES
jgi:hypothetical protein